MGIKRSVMAVAGVMVSALAQADMGERYERRCETRSEWRETRHWQSHQVWRGSYATGVEPVVIREAVPVMPAPSAQVSGAMIGAVAGGLIGNGVGRGNGRIAAAAIGAALGAVVGDRLQRY